VSPADGGESECDRETCYRSIWLYVLDLVYGETFKMTSKFYYQLKHKRIDLKKSIKIYIKTVPTYFGVITIIRERTI